MTCINCTALTRKSPVEDSLGALKKMQDAGKIRHVGLSEVTVQEIERAKKVMPIVSVQNRYNIEDRDAENVLAYCEKEKMGFIPWAPIGRSRKPLAQGRQSARGRSETTRG